MKMSLKLLTPSSWHYADVTSSSLDQVDWSECTQFPTEIHLELRAAGKIPDWNKGRAEHDVQCGITNDQSKRHC